MAWIASNGYVRMRHNGQEVYQHRVVAAEVLGRPLQPDEQVHHRNGVKTDNRPENLEVVDSRHHLLEHWRDGHYDPRVQSQQVPHRPCEDCGELAKIHGQNLCRRCYMAAAQRKYKAKNPERVRQMQREARARRRLRREAESA